MKKLCIDARMIAHSGIGTYLQNILPHLAGKFSITLLGSKKLLTALFDEAQIAIINFEAPIYSIREIFLMPFKIPSCDIFWSPHYNVPVFPIRAKKRITTIHDVFHLVFMDQLTFPQKVYAKVLIGAAVRNSARIITVSAFSKSEIIKYTGVSADKVSVIYNGVDTHKFQGIIDIVELENVKVKYQLPERYLLFVGNVKPHKNLHALLLALSLLKQECGEKFCKLAIVGKKEGFINGDEKIDGLISSLNLANEVLFLGAVDGNDLPGIYSSCTLFVFPSLYEGFGLPPLEAMACGSPVLLSNKACMPEIFGAEANYFDAEDPQSLKNAIMDFLQKESVCKENMVKIGYGIVKKYSWERSAMQLITILNQI